MYNCHSNRNIGFYRIACTSKRKNIWFVKKSQYTAHNIQHTITVYSPTDHSRPIFSRTCVFWYNICGFIFILKLFIDNFSTAFEFQSGLVIPIEHYDNNFSQSSCYQIHQQKYRAKVSEIHTNENVSIKFSDDLLNSIVSEKSFSIWIDYFFSDFFRWKNRCFLCVKSDHSIWLKKRIIFY